METVVAQGAGPNGKNHTHEYGRGLPDSFEELIAQVPHNSEGVSKVQWLHERIDAIPEVDRRAVADLFDEWTANMVELDATDLDVGGESCLEQLWFRIDGIKNPEPDLGKYTIDESELLLLSNLTPHQRERLISRYAIDFGKSLKSEDPTEPDRRFRATIYFDNKRLALSMRMLAWKPRPLQSLGFHPLVERGLLFRYVRDGLTLITGVTGSGKSTTLDAIVNANNEDVQAQVIIIAQPLEYIHTSKKCIVRHREVGTDVASYVDGMVQALRQDPDIVVVGEMRDAESISTAMETADTGHKVFSTLHTGSAIETVDRIVAEYPPVEQSRVRNRLADVVRCIVSQKLLPAVGGGRVLAKEVMWMTPASRAAIKNDNANEIYQMMWSGTDQGQITLEQDLYRLIQRGDILPDIAISYANNKRRLLQLLQ